MNIDESGRRLGKLLANRDGLFVLWTIHTGLHKTRKDLRTHISNKLDTDEIIAMLVQEGFLEEHDGHLTLTDLGREAVAHLEMPAEVDPEAGLGPSLSTGIPTLDTMLGGSGIRQGSTVLLRGQPGAGKTTLSLQVARAAITQGHAFVFIAVEEDPDEALNQITRSLWSESLRSFLNGDDRWCTFNLTRVWDLIQRQQAKSLLSEVRLPMGFEQEWAGPQPLDDDPALAQRSAEAMMKETAVDENLADLWKMVQGLKPFALSESTLVVIDSLSALTNNAQFRFQSADPRQMLLAVLRSFDAWRKGLRLLGKQLTVVFTAEDTAESRSVAAESYIADVVIQLKHEPRSHPIPTSPDPSSFTDWKEDLKFCRVLKGRGLAIQRRPCCYEFVNGKGITLFPTYAAQGLISLFHENPPQLEVIHHLRMVDAPSIYPGVVVQEFTRSAMQRIFAVKRYAHQIPAPHSLLLSNVDEYWVKELGNENLLEPIPAELLKLYSLEKAEGPDPKRTQIIHELVHAKGTIYRDRVSDGWPFLAVPQMGNVGMLVYRKDLVPEPPATWEELEDMASGLQRDGMPHPLLLETRTYDTFMTIALELVWGHGADVETLLDKEQRKRTRYDRTGGFLRLVAAIRRLHEWIHVKKIVPLNSSIDPGINPNPNWAFARHWYSTWIDYRQRKNRNARPLIEFPAAAEYGVAPIPISREYRDEQLARLPTGSKDTRIQHHSGWGEWYLAIQRGSENVELGVDLINNLMTSRKVSERANSGASLPLLEPFYKNSGKALCPETDQTFDQIRALFFRDARSRAGIKGYRRFARVLSGVLRTVITNPDPRLKIETLLKEALSTIDRELRDSGGQLESS